jgi:hypothetical protein
MNLTDPTEEMLQVRVDALLNYIRLLFADAHRLDDPWLSEVREKLGSIPRGAPSHKGESPFAHTYTLVETFHKELSEMPPDARIHEALRPDRLNLVTSTQPTPLHPALAACFEVEMMDIEDIVGPPYGDAFDQMYGDVLDDESREEFKREVERFLDDQKKEDDSDS